MAWPWPWWKKLTLLLHHFYKPDFLQFSSTRFGCQADTSWDISLWNISVAATWEGRRRDTTGNCGYLYSLTPRQTGGSVTELFIPSHLLGACWAQREACQSRGGELLRRADLTRGGAVLSQHCPTSQDRTGQKRRWDNWDMLLDFWNNWETTVATLWLQILEF